MNCAGEWRIWPDSEGERIAAAAIDVRAAEQNSPLLALEMSCSCVMGGSTVGRKCAAGGLTRRRQNADNAIDAAEGNATMQPYIVLAEYGNSWHRQT